LELCLFDEAPFFIESDNSSGNDCFREDSK